jgi:AcrR family transcriptional regulator
MTLAENPARPAADRVIDAANELFAERGYAATTTRAIAERAGVNEVTLFRRFGSKAGILRAWAERLASDSAGFAVVDALDPADLRATLTVLAKLEVHGALRNGGAAMRLAFEAASVPELAELIGEGPLGNMRGLAAYFAERQAAGAVRSDIDPHVMSEAFFATTSSVVMMRTFLGGGARPYEMDPDEVVEQLVELFLSGVLAGSDGRRVDDHGADERE